MIRKFLPLLFIFLAGTFSAKADFNFNNNCVDSYKAIFDLRINDARSLIQKEKQQDPQNGIIVLLENYIDYFSLLASESKTDYEKLKDNESVRLGALEGNDGNSPFYLFSQAEVYLQWSALKAKFGDFFSSGLDAKKARNLLKDNDEKYPDFLLNQKGLALVNVSFGSIPANLKAVTRFLGMSGNLQQGISQLEALKGKLLKTKYSFYNCEMIYHLCNIDINIVRSADSYAKLISWLSEMDNRSLLKTYLQGDAAAKTAHNDEAIAFFEARPKSGDYIKVPVMDYLLGCAKLNRMDKDTPAILENYVREFRGANYIKDAYLKLAYYYLLQNDQGKYDYYIKLVKSKGYAADGKDQEALSEANDVKPDIDLLKARFYFDGGYYAKALAQVVNKDENSFKLLRDRTEFCYRLGRIYDRTGKTNDAILNYQKAINLGKETKYYYAANAAISIGLIFEQKKDYKRAGDYYNQALDMHGHQYQTDTDNDAKAGLKRIGQ